MALSWHQACSIALGQCLLGIAATRPYTHAVLSVRRGRYSATRAHGRLPNTLVTPTHAVDFARTINNDTAAARLTLKRAEGAHALATTPPRLLPPPPPPPPLVCVALQGAVFVSASTLLSCFQQGPQSPCASPWPSSMTPCRQNIRCKGMHSCRNASSLYHTNRSSNSTRRY